MLYVEPKYLPFAETLNFSSKINSSSTKPIWSLASCSIESIGHPFTLMAPESLCYRFRIVRIREVLPDPLRPISPKMYPGSRVNEISCRCRVPICLSRWEIFNNGFIWQSLLSGWGNTTVYVYIYSIYTDIRYVKQIRKRLYRKRNTE